jgi:hypothetical protein
VAGLKAALKPLQDKIPGLALQSAVNTTWLKAFEHYANANTDPTTPYSMVRMHSPVFTYHILTQQSPSKKISTPKASRSKASTAPP